MAEDGYSGVEVRITPKRTEIIILATRTQNVLGEKAKRIRELTALVQKRFQMKDGQVELFAEKVSRFHFTTGKRAFGMITIVGFESKFDTSCVIDYFMTACFVIVTLKSIFTVQNSGLDQTEITNPRSPTVVFAPPPSASPCATSSWVVLPSDVPPMVSSASSWSPAPK